MEEATRFGIMNTNEDEKSLSLMKNQKIQKAI